MKIYTEKIKKLISDKSLPPQDKDALLNGISRITADEQEAAVDFLSVDQGLLRRVIHNYKTKQEAIAADSPEMWEKIVREEEQILREMTE